MMEWQQHHRVARAEVTRRITSGDQLVIPAHCLVESYATLTRFPAPHRMSPATAIGLLRRMYVGRATIFAPAAADYLPLLDRSARASVAGGAIYDAAIGAAAVAAGAELLLTFNVRHFERLGLGIEVREPRV
ncbi:MAG: hypothetical protein IPO51_06970 [Dehalococcoidia bacterium]|nr:hypothetical protein [Dehalococcoidia bacterium]